MYLLSSVSPATAPASSHRRGSAPRVMRTTSSAKSGQVQSPTMSVEGFMPKVISTLVKRKISAAKACAKKPPPNSETSKQVV